MSHTFVIAEAASCHDGQLDKAIELIRVAKGIGADAVKFQWTSSPTRMVARRNAPEYLKSYEVIAHPVEWHSILKQNCDRLGIEYMTTVYLPEDIEVIAPFVKRFKVASFEAGDLDFVWAHAKWKMPVISSLGMNPHKYAEGLTLHCVSAYPTPLDQINLARVRDCDGLSDHTTNSITGALAVAAGASIIEFHLRLHGTSIGNADFLVARDPIRAKDYVANIRLAEIMMGDGKRGVQPCEEKMLKYRVKA